MYDFIRKNKLAYAFLFSFLITLLTFIINNSDTSLIALMVIGIGVLFHKIVILNKIFNFKLMFGVSFFISSFFILDYFTQPLRLLIEYLGKVNTFGRFDLWKDSLYYLSIKPFLGYGIEYDDVIIEKFGYAQTHNRYLDTAYIGGLLGLVIFMVLLFYINKKLERDRKSRIGKIITILYSAYFVSYITETKRLDVLMFGIMLLTIYAVKQNYYYRSVEKNGV
jgi:O-antigen ligase